MEEFSIKIICLTLSSVIIALLSSYLDARTIKLNWGKIVSIKHFHRWAIRGALFIVGAFITSKDWLKIIELIIYQALVFWLYFDIYLNLALDRSPVYIGKTSYIDIFVSKYIGGIGLVIIKEILIIISLIILILW